MVAADAGTVRELNPARAIPIFIFILISNNCSA
jgi:hypothetical protein